MIDENSTKKEVLEAVRHDASALQCASDELQNDRDVVMAEIKQNLKALLSIHGAALERMEQEVKND